MLLRNRLAVGGGVWTAEDMAELARCGYTHIVNLQAEFDDSALAAVAGLQSFWNPTEDDLARKPPGFFEPAVRFALKALEQPGNSVYVHCAAGVHRGPLLAAAILCAIGYDPDQAMAWISDRRVGADFPEPYRASLRAWVEQRAG